MDSDYTLHCGPNDGISRGDREDTGDLEARPSGRELRSEDLEDLTIVDAEDPSLGLTNIAGRGPGDWAADTGPAQADEGGAGVMTTDPGDRGSTLGHDRPRNMPDYEDQVPDLELHRERPEPSRKR